MATIKFTGLSKGQANAIGIIAESGELEDFLNSLFPKYEVDPLEVSDVSFDPSFDPNNEIEFKEVEIEGDEDDDEIEEDNELETEG
jgi:hypothetical protein